MGRIIVGVCFLLSVPAFAAPFLEPLPSWARDSLYDENALDIDQVMKEENLSRFEAVEVQNYTRDLIKYSGRDRETAYRTGLNYVRSKKYESGWQPIETWSVADYVAVLDLDETLLMQWYASGYEGNFDLKNLTPDFANGLRSPPYVKFTPGAESFIRKLKTDPHCRAVVVFSAKDDLAANEIINRWVLSDGKPARSLISAVFTRHHLVMGPKVTVPSKDLRIIDPELKHVVMVDDNPGRIFQPLVLLAQPKFDADQYNLASKSNDEDSVEIRNHYESALDSAANDILETARAAERMAIPFAQAFLPHSYFGERVTKAMSRSTGSRSKALNMVRRHPFLQEAAFVRGK